MNIFWCLHCALLDRGFPTHHLSQVPGVYSAFEADLFSGIALTSKLLVGALFQFLPGRIQTLGHVQPDLPRLPCRQHAQNTLLIAMEVIGSSHTISRKCCRPGTGNHPSHIHVLHQTPHVQWPAASISNQGIVGGIKSLRQQCRTKVVLHPGMKQVQDFA